MGRRLPRCSASTTPHAFANVAISCLLYDASCAKPGRTTPWTEHSLPVVMPPYRACDLAGAMPPVDCLSALSPCYAHPVSTPASFPAFWLHLLSACPDCFPIPLPSLTARGRAAAFHLIHAVFVSPLHAVYRTHLAYSKQAAHLRALVCLLRVLLCLRRDSVCCCAARDNGRMQAFCRFATSLRIYDIFVCGCAAFTINSPVPHLHLIKRCRAGLSAASLARGMFVPILRWRQFCYLLW